MNKQNLMICGKSKSQGYGCVRGGENLVSVTTTAEIIRKIT